MHPTAILPLPQVSRHVLSVSYLQEHTRKGSVSHAPSSILRAQLSGACGVAGKDGAFETFAELFSFGAKDLLSGCDGGEGGGGGGGEGGVGGGDGDGSCGGGGGSDGGCGGGGGGPEVGGKVVVTPRDAPLLPGIRIPVCDLSAAVRRHLAAFLDPPHPMGKDWCLLAMALNLEDSMPDILGEREEGSSSEAASGAAAAAALTSALGMAASKMVAAKEDKKTGGGGQSSLMLSNTDKLLRCWAVKAASGSDGRVRRGSGNGGDQFLSKRGEGGGGGGGGGARSDHCCTVEELVKKLKEIGREDVVDGLLEEVPAFRMKRVSTLRTQLGENGGKEGEREINQSRDSGISGEHGGSR